MPSFEQNGVTLYYEEQGTGFPLLLLAPGGMRSIIARWDSAPFDPRKELGSDFRVIAMDQRNAGRSSAPVRASDGWQTYARDQLALIDRLGIERCHLLGGCIGGAFCLSLIALAPERIASAVLQQPIGLSADNRAMFYELFDGWKTELESSRSELAPEAFRGFRERMYGGDFVFSVSREKLRSCPAPLLVLMGNDPYHPSEISREIVELAPRATLIENWKEPHVRTTVERVRAFLKEHTPRTS